MRIRPAREGRRTARPGRSRLRAFTSRPPRWVMVLGTVLLLSEVAGAAVLLTERPYRPMGPPAAKQTPGPHGGMQTPPGPHGGMQTVVLRVDAVPMAKDTCVPAPHDPCGPHVEYSTYVSTPGTGTIVPAPVHLPFIRKIRVEAGQSVGLNASSGTDSQITCSITAGNRILSRITAFTDKFNFTAAGIAGCHSTIPDGETDPGAARRTAVLRVDAVPTGTCSHACSGGVNFTTPTGDVTDSSAAVPFITRIPVPPGGIVTLKGTFPVKTRVSCSITVNGTVLSQATIPNLQAATPDFTEADCHGIVPGAETTPGPPGGTRKVDLWATLVPTVPEDASGATVTYTTPAGSQTLTAPASPVNTTVSVPAGGSVTLSAFAGSSEPVTCSIMADGRALSQVTTPGRATCQARIP